VIERPGGGRNHLCMSVTARPAATARADSFPAVREIPPVLRPGRFDSTW
jgi:hypothetical protein